jgi:hypothetical protein
VSIIRPLTVIIFGMIWLSYVSYVYNGYVYNGYVCNGLVCNGYVFEEENCEICDI